MSCGGECNCEKLQDREARNWKCLESSLDKEVMCLFCRGLISECTEHV